MALELLLQGQLAPYSAKVRLDLMAVGAYKRGRYNQVGDMGRARHIYNHKDPFPSQHQVN